MKITFGKYKNQELSKIHHEDEWYKNWLLKELFFKTKYPDMYNYLINYKLAECKPIKYIDNTKGFILCDDIMGMIGEYFKKIPNKPVDKIKFIHRCKRCQKASYCYSIDTNNGKYWTDSCGDCNVKDRENFEKRRYQYRISERCECGKNKKSEYWTCYSCNQQGKLGWGGSPIYKKWNYDMFGCPI